MGGLCRAFGRRERSPDSLWIWLSSLGREHHFLHFTYCICTIHKVQHVGVPLWDGCLFVLYVLRRNPWVLGLGLSIFNVGCHVELFVSTSSGPFSQMVQYHRFALPILNSGNPSSLFRDSGGFKLGIVKPKGSQTGSGKTAQKWMKNSSKHK